MGCGTSRAVEAGPNKEYDGGSAEYERTGAGGSMILAAPSAGKRPGKSGEAGVPAPPGVGPDGTLLVSKGGSMIIGRKRAGDWEPGSGPAEPPPGTSATQVFYIPVSPTHLLRVSYAAATIQGRSPRPPHKPNQDSFVTLQCLGDDPSLALFAVFDGHGPRGEDASNYCRVNLSDICVQQPDFPTAPFEALTSSFETLHRRFISPSTARAGVDTTVSGSTAVAIMLHGNQWVCANVGDSRAMVASRSPGGGLVSKALSSDHKPHRPDERARISRTGAKILSEKQLGIEGGDADKWYVCRVHQGSIKYGVLFTRSIGDADAHTHLGLLATPEVRRGTLQPGKDRFMVLATDGVWDYLTEDAVAKLVVQGAGLQADDDSSTGPDDAQSAVAAVAAASRRRWDEDGSGGRRDDITAVVLMFRTLTREQAEAEAAAADAAAAGGSGSGSGGAGAGAGAGARVVPASPIATTTVTTVASAGGAVSRLVPPAESTSLSADGSVSAATRSSPAAAAAVMVALEQQQQEEGEEDEEEGDEEEGDEEEDGEDGEEEEEEEDGDEEEPQRPA